MKNPYVYLLGIAWKYAHNARKTYIWLYFRFMLSNIVAALYPVAWGVFVNDVQKNGLEVLKHAWLYALWFLGIRLGDWFFHGPARIVERKMAFDISQNMMQELYHKTLRLPVKWHQDHHSGATINRIKKATTAIKQFFQSGFEYLHTLFKFVFSFGAMLYFSPIYGAVGLVLGVLIVVIILQFDKPYIKTLDQVNEAEHEVSSNLFDSLSNVVTVITLRLEKRLENSLMSKVSAILPPFMQNVKINEWKWFVVDMLVGLIYCIVFLGYVHQNYVPGQVFLLGGLVALIGYVERFTSVFHNVAYLYTDVVQHATDVRAAQSILDAYEQEKVHDLNGDIDQNWQKISVENLSFIHHSLGEGQSKTGLFDLHFELRKGQKIAIVGPSGGGKSTLLAVLRGLFESENEEKLFVDGQSQALGLDFIRDQITLFPQDPEIFENTIEYNITLGLSASDQDIQNAIDAAQFTEVLQQLPHGLQSHIVEKGVNLSGGQKQRLALARGLFAAQDSSIVLLDEPTSSIDAKTELEIYKAIFEICQDKVLMSSLHRLHLLQYFDEVWLMDQGRIIEKGSLAELLDRSEPFRELWRHQEVNL